MEGIIDLALGGYILIDGIYTLINGHSMTQKERNLAAKHDLDAYKRWSRITAVTTILLALAILYGWASRSGFVPVFENAFLVILIICAAVIVIAIASWFAIVKPADKARAQRGYGKKGSVKNRKGGNDGYIDED